MTVQELRKLLHGAKPDALIVVHIDQRRTYDIKSVVHTNQFDEEGKPVQVIDVCIKKR